MTNEDRIEAIRASITGSGKSWVMFEHGTCVILMEPEADLAAQATALLAEWGPVHAGSPAGDFGTITLDNGLGWAVTCHHSDILTFIGRDELDEEASDLVAGVFGRSRRGEDAGGLNVLHVEDLRGER
ncbi:MAG: hypothetical protein ACI8RZ_001029 [Myxococcota bacterium]|jgi:hypothetical protein